jgi:uncharacterized RDD family membrane protein YckC
MVATLVYGFYQGFARVHALVGLVVNSDGSNCAVGASILRNLLWVVDALPAANLVAMVLIPGTDNNQRVGDLVADTVVVR